MGYKIVKNVDVRSLAGLPQFGFKVVVFKASENSAFCELFAKGHKKVLEDFGVKNVSSSNDEWMCSPRTYCVSYFDKDNNMVGGIRVEFATKNHLLPISTAIARYDPSITNMINRATKGGIGEICGMWTDRKVSGLGVGGGLVRFAAYIIYKTKAQTGICLVTKYTKILVEKYGFRVDERFGDKGTFEYPDARYIATVMTLIRPQDESLIITEELKHLYAIYNGSRTTIERFSNHYLKLNLDLCFD